MISYHDQPKALRDAETAQRHLEGKPPIATGDARKGPSQETPEQVRKRCGDKTQG